MTGQISKALTLRGADERELTASLDYARKLAASELLPKAYQGKPQNVLVAIEYGRSIGIAPITAINMVHTIQGKPTASAQLIGALVHRAGHTMRVRGDATTATAQIIRADDSAFTHESTWTLEDAKTAGLLSNPTWKAYPKAMLKARAISEVARDACPEVLAGIAYLPEELGADVAPVLPSTDESGVVDDDVLDVESSEDGLWGDAS